MVVSKQLFKMARSDKNDFYGRLNSPLSYLLFSIGGFLIGRLSIALPVEYKLSSVVDSSISSSEYAEAIIGGPIVGILEVVFGLILPILAASVGGLSACSAANIELSKKAAFVIASVRVQFRK